MAKYLVDSVNYVTVGKTEKILNLDISLPERSTVLGVEEDLTLAIKTEGVDSSFVSIYDVERYEKSIELKN